MAIIKNTQRHSFHLVDPSPWPLISAVSALMVTFGGVLYMHGFATIKVLLFGLLMLLFMMWCWWSDIIRESVMEGQHTQSVQDGLKLGMILFIVSEIMFFFAFFWAYFHLSFNPSFVIGGVWPPISISSLDSSKVPLLNTILLLTSGATITLSHNFIVSKYGEPGLKALEITIILAIIFTALQGYEYVSASFTISDSVYGSTFYMLTGFHGFHVIIGTIFLFVSWARIKAGHYTQEQHFGFEAAAWYWHFVDVVWLFLFISIYWWGA